MSNNQEVAYWRSNTQTETYCRTFVNSDGTVSVSEHYLLSGERVQEKANTRYVDVWDAGKFMAMWGWYIDREFIAP